MFTGLVQEKAAILEITETSGGLTLTVARPPSFENLKNGESIAVDGVCLTLTTFDGVSMKFFAGVETLKVTAMEKLLADGGMRRPVNLERSLAFGDRVGGHLVSGHVDGTARVFRAERIGACLDLRFQTLPQFMKLIIPKGSVCLNGVSLTVNTVAKSKNLFDVLLIPETLKRTNLNDLTEGDVVNLECDSMVKIVTHQLENRESLRELNP